MVKDIIYFHLATKAALAFDKGKNALGDKVVEVQEDAEYEFLALKKFASLTYPEYYNKFIELKMFKRAIKYGSKYVTLQRGGIDRSVTDDGIFFYDSRVQFVLVRLIRKGKCSVSTSDLKNRELPVTIEGDVDLSNTSLQMFLWKLHQKVLQKKRGCPELLDSLLYFL